MIPFFSSISPHSSALGKNKAITGSNIKFGTEYYSLFEKDITSKDNYITHKEVSVLNKRYIQANDGNKNSYTLQFEVSKKEVSDKLHELYTNVIKNFIVVLSSALISLFFIMKLLGHRILRFAGEISKLGAGDKFKLKKSSKNKDIVPLANSINQLIDRFQAESDLKIELEKEKVKTRVSNQVAHDILSPLTSLDFFITSAKNSLSENERIVAKQSLERIHDIINCLNPESERPLNADSSTELLHTLVSRIVAEKRVEYRNRPEVAIYFESHLEYGIFVNISRSEIARSISNLVNNSIEAKRLDINKIEITLFLVKTSNKTCKIIIRDNGKGIATEDLSLVLNEGESLDKPKGKGLGLTYAKEVIERHHGIFNISSTVGFGTTIELELKLAQKPNWFRPALNFSTNRICIIDDELVHSTRRLASESYGQKLHSFYNIESFLSCADHFDFDVPIYIDSNLENGIKGEIESIKIFEYGFKNIHLVTGQKGVTLPMWVRDQQGKAYPSLSN